MSVPLPYSEYKGKVVLLTGIGQSDKVGSPCHIVGSELH